MKTTLVKAFGLLGIASIVSLSSCRKEIGNDEIPSDQKIYLKSFSMTEDETPNDGNTDDSFVYELRYNSNNVMTGYLKSDYSGGILFEQTEASFAWLSSTQFKVSNNDFVNGYDIYTIPTSANEADRVATKIEMYNGSGVMYGYFDLEPASNSSYVKSVKLYYFVNGIAKIAYTANVETSGNQYKVTYTEYEYDNPVETITTLKKFTYTLGSRPNRNIKTAREFYWLTCAWPKDELEDDCTSPYWQAATLPECVTLENYDFQTQQWELITPNYSTSFMSNPMSEYLQELRSTINDYTVKYNFDWEAR